MIKDSYICGSVIQEKNKSGDGGAGMCANYVENMGLDYFEVILAPDGPKEVS